MLQFNDYLARLIILSILPPNDKQEKHRFSPVLFCHKDLKR